MRRPSSRPGLQNHRLGLQNVIQTYKTTSGLTNRRPGPQNCRSGLQNCRRGIQNVTEARPDLQNLSSGIDFRAEKNCHPGPALQNLVRAMQNCSPSAQNCRPDLQNTKTVVQAYKIIVLAYRTAVQVNKTAAWAYTYRNC